MRRIFPSALMVLVLALGLMAWLVAPASADDPPPGLPWGKGTPWPTAMPLKVGQPFSPNGSAPPVIRQVQPLAVATKVRPAAPVIPAPVVPTRVPSPAPALAAPVVPTPVPPSPTAVPVVPTPVPVVPTPVPPPVSVAPVVPTPAPTALPVSASNSGSDISNALEPGDTWRTLSSGATVWFRVGYAQSAGVNMDVWLDLSADSNSNVDLSVYAPNQLDNLSGPPAGHGTPFQHDPKRLHWKGGGSNAIYGVWYARITNNNPSAILYRLTTENVLIAPKSCVSYWEYIGTNYVYWTACQ